MSGALAAANQPKIIGLATKPKSGAFTNSGTSVRSLTRPAREVGVYFTRFMRAAKYLLNAKSSGWSVRS